jgi:hypothetical protein
MFFLKVFCFKCASICTHMNCSHVEICVRVHAYVIASWWQGMGSSFEVTEVDES